MSDLAAHILAMPAEDHRTQAAEYLSLARERYLNTSEGAVLASIAHSLLALTAPQEKP